MAGCEYGMETYDILCVPIAYRSILVPQLGSGNFFAVGEGGGGGGGGV